MKVVCVAGELSGDRLLGPVVAALRAAGHSVRGIGGPASQAAGLEPLFPFEGLAASGLQEAAGTLGAAIAAYRTIVAALDSADVFLGVDFPEVNLRLLRKARARGLFTALISPPQAWAWRPWRARAVAQADWVGCLFPFAARWYRAHGVAAHAVGHPLAALEPAPGGVGIGLMPGSRMPSVKALLPTQLAVAAALHRQTGRPAVLALAPDLDRSWIEAAVRAADTPVSVVADPEGMFAQVALVLAGMGTATLHSVLAGRPVVGMARVAPLTAAVGSCLLRCEALALPNLVLGERVFPEHVQHGCTPSRVLASVTAMLGELGRFEAAVQTVREGIGGPYFAPQRFVEAVAARRISPVAF